jgi:hypothetical protein
MNITIGFVMKKYSGNAIKYAQIVDFEFLPKKQQIYPFLAA